MEYIIKDGAPVLLYRVKGGHATASLALEAARAAGLASLIARAKTVADCAQVILTYSPVRRQFANLKLLARLRSLGNQ